jgi:hypothetical protein
MEVRIALGGAMVVSAVLGLWFSRGTTVGTDWLYAFSSTPHLDLRGAIEPENGHLVLTGRLAHAAVLHLFGAGDLPYRLLTAASVLLTAGLFFVFARQRIGPVAALAPTLVLLFYGSDAEHVISGNGFIFMLALAAGIGALLALERDDLSGDLGACLLLCLAIATYSVGLAFVAGAAVLIMIGADRWRRAWVFIVPALLYGAWFLWSRAAGAGVSSPETEGGLQASNLLLVPNWALNSLGAVGSSLMGLNYQYPPSANSWGPLVAVVTLVALGWRLLRGRVPRWLWAGMALPAFLWTIEAMAAAPPARVPQSSRYLLSGAIAVLIVAAEAARDVRLARGGVIALYVVAAIGVSTNIALLQDGQKKLRAKEATAQPELTAVEIAGGRVGPQPPALSNVPWVMRVTGQPDPNRAVSRPAAGGRARLWTGPPGRPYLATGYMEAVREFGSPALSLPELRAQPELPRERVDAYLVDSLGLHLQPTSRPGSHCQQITPNTAQATGGGSQSLQRFNTAVRFKLPAGGVVLVTRGQSAPLRLRRFGTFFSVQVGMLQPGVPMALRIPRDSAPDAWCASIPSSAVLACGLSG